MTALATIATVLGVVLALSVCYATLNDYPDWVGVAVVFCAAGLFLCFIVWVSSPPFLTLISAENGRLHMVRYGDVICECVSVEESPKREEK